MFKCCVNELFASFQKMIPNSVRWFHQFREHFYVLRIILIFINEGIQLAKCIDHIVVQNTKTTRFRLYVMPTICTTKALSSLCTNTEYFNIDSH